MNQQSEHISLQGKNTSIKNWLLKQLKIFIALSFIITVTFTACKKNDLEKLTCRVTSVYIPSSATIYHLSYNSNGKLSRATGGPVEILYEYIGNTIIVTTLDSGKFLSKSIIIANTAGLATSVKTENNVTGTDWASTIYEYNGEELIKATTTSSTVAVASVTTYAWSGHNVTHITETPGTPMVLDYYMDKPRQTGDYLSTVQLFDGYETLRNKNLLKTYSELNFVYNFSPDGNISSVGTASNNQKIFEYAYQCN
jgi:hypothetical protein